MSSRAALIAIFVCGLLGLTAYWFTSRPPAVALPAALPAFEADRLRSINLMREGDAARHIRRNTAGQWVLDGASTWPVEVVRVRAAGTLINQLLQSESAPDPGPFRSKTTIVAEDQSDNMLTIGLADSVIGGRLFAQITSGGAPLPRMAKSDFAGIFTASGFDAWRSTTVFTALAEQPTRIELASAKGSTTLRRNLGRWGLERTPPVPADADRVKALISQLALMKIDRFLDGDAGVSTNLSNPAATITVSTDFRSGPDDPKRVILQTLRIGTAADAAATTVIADLTAKWEDTGEALWGPQAFAIPVSLVSGISADPAQLAARVPMTAPPADVGVIRLTKVGAENGAAASEWKRTLDGWSQSQGPEALAKHAAVMMEILSTPAAFVSFPPPESTTPIATLTVLSPGNAMLEIVEIHAALEPGIGAVWLRTGEVWRQLSSTPRQVEAVAAVREALSAS